MVQSHPAPELLELPNCQLLELISWDRQPTVIGTVMEPMRSPPGFQTTCNQHGPLVCQKALVVKLSNRLPTWPETSQWKNGQAKGKKQQQVDGENPVITHNTPCRSVGWNPTKNRALNVKLNAKSLMLGLLSPKFHMNIYQISLHVHHSECPSTPLHSNPACYNGP